MVRAPQARRAAGLPARASATGAPGSRAAVPGSWSRRRLAGGSDELVASDVSDDRGRAGPASAPRDLPGVQVRALRRCPRCPFDGPVDLVVAAEFLYYVPDLAGRARRALVGVRAGRPPGGRALGAPPARRVPQRSVDARPDPPRLHPAQRHHARQPRRPGLPARRLRGARVSGLDLAASTPTRSARPPTRCATPCAGSPAAHADVWTGPFPDFADALTELGRVDLCLARLVEGHADALRILDQAGAAPAPGRVRRLGLPLRRHRRRTPRRTGPAGGSTGSSRFASGIDVVDRALLPGWVDADTHLLFDVARRRPSSADRDSWHTSAMDASRSFTVRRRPAPCAADVVVGPENFYLRRPRLPGRRPRRRGRLGRRRAVGARAGRRRAAPVRAVRPPDCAGSA